MNTIAINIKNPFLKELTDFLLNTLPFSAEYDSSEDVEQTSYEKLVFKGESYLFANDKLIEKKKVDDETDMGEDKFESEVSSDGS